MEPTGEVLGTPFFLMDRIEGIVPPDVLPYNFGDNWLFDASPEEQRRLQDSTVGVLAGLHAIPDAAATFAFLDPGRHLAGAAASGTRWRATSRPGVRGTSSPSPTSARSPMVERDLAWLEANLPADPGDTVLCWGDARIGNMMYRDFAPVAVLDWEMATIGPRELDVSWMVFAHQVFESIADAVRAAGHAALHARGGRRSRRTTSSPASRLGDLTWYHLYNAAAVVHRLHAHRRAADPLRRDRAAGRRRDAVPPQAAVRAAPRRRSGI